MTPHALRLVFVLAAVFIWPGLPAMAAEELEIPRLTIQSQGATTTYEDVVVLKVTEAGIRIAHKDGLATVAFSQLPPDLRSRFGPKSNNSDSEPRWPATAAPDRTRPGPAPEPAPAPAAPPPPLAPTWATGAKPGRGTVTAPESFDPNCLVMIETDGNGGPGYGSGFIAREGGRDYIYTNAHVICGDAEDGFSLRLTKIVTPLGRSIPLPDEIEFSNEPCTPNLVGGLDDMVRFPFHVTDERAYEIAAMSNTNAGMNEDVIAYGDSGGKGVVTSLEGKVIGVGPGILEISCEFVPGNSGGPVVLKNTKQVVGISTYITGGGSDFTTRGTRFAQARRFALRPDKVRGWHKMPTPSLFQLLAALENYHRDSLSLAAACCLTPKSNRGGFVIPRAQIEGMEVADIINEGGSNYLGGLIHNGILSVNERLGNLGGSKAHTNISKSTAVPLFDQFFSSIIAASGFQSRQLRQAERPPYLKRFDEELVATRQEVQAEFESARQRFQFQESR